MLIPLAVLLSVVSSPAAPANAGVASTIQARQDSSLRARIDAWRAAREGAILRELADLLAIPNVAADTANIRRNARHLVTMLERRGVRARVLDAPGSRPAVYGELASPGATRTVVFYAHYDGQPVDPARWATPPWRPTLRDRAHTAGGREIPWPEPAGRVDPEARLYARSASDDKSPIVAMLAALDALRALGQRPSVNLKFFFEGEEEAGSPALREMLTRYAELLRADLWIFGDGPVHQSRRHLVSFGVRGVVGVQLSVYGPARPLHSGHYGNWAPNPNVMMAHLLASLRDEEGRILIDRFYDDVRPFSAMQAQALAAYPRLEDALQGELRLGRTEGGDAPLAELTSRPALNVSGVSGGRTGAGASNVIVPEATAYLDFRLVPDQRPERVLALLEGHFRARGYHVVHADPDSATRRAHARIVKVTSGGGYPATGTPLDLPAARAVVRAAEAALGERVLLQPPMGGSLPLFHFEEVLRTPLILVPIVNHDNNQHAENENLRVKNLWDGIALYGGLLARLEAAWRSVERPVP